MQGGHFLEYALAAALAIALLYAAWTDFSRREIENWLNAAIFLGAPLWWHAHGLGWTVISLQVAMMLAVFLVLLGLFWLGQMGGGDVKLLTALALWFLPKWFVPLLIVMSLAGLVLTLVMYAAHRARKREDPLKVPYGIAIAFAGLWMLADFYLPVLRDAGLLG